MIGLMLLDQSDRPLLDKIRSAANHYYGKHGRWPTVCQVQFTGEEKVGTVEYGVDLSLRLEPVLNMTRHGYMLIGEYGGRPCT